MKASSIHQLTSVILSTALLSACGGSSSGGDDAPSATFSAPATLQLRAGSPGTLTIVNDSRIAVTNVHAELPANWTDVTQDASDCAILEASGACTLAFTPGETTYPATTVAIVGDNTESIAVTITVDPPLGAAIAVAGMPLRLEVGSSTPSPIVVTNLSNTMTATNIVADLSGTPLQNSVTQDASGCASVAPQASCSLLFTPMNTAVTLTSFPIRGDNTTQAGGAIAIELPTVATLTVDDSPLVLQATNGAPVAGTLTITNTSAFVTATNIAADIASTALAGQITQDTSNCTSLLPNTSCTLSFVPASSAVAATPVIIQGDNTSQVGASIAVNAAPQPLLAITGSPLTLVLNGSAGNLTVTNLSTTETAQNIVANFNGTSLAGNVTETGNTCASLSPSASCTLTFTPGGTPVAQTSFPIAGTNTQTATADITIRGLQVGDNFAGGIIYLMPNGGQPGKIVSSAQGGVPWDDGAGPFAATGATGTTDGAANTTAIVGLLGARTSYAAGYCDAYSVVEDGVTYDDWYLPAIDELVELLQQTTNAGGVIAGFTFPYYWASTEHTSANARLASPSDPANFNFDTKARTTWGTRCVRPFI